jgi:2-polyprenyl-3-methyl-5-hydroxy-6-metoxy-1,4-benzoquinol methylase
MIKDSFLYKGKNCFGYEKYSPLILFTDKYKHLKEEIRSDAVKYLFADKSHIFDEIEKVCKEELTRAGKSQSSLDIELEVERKLHFSQNQNGFVQNRLKERCYRIKEQILASVSDLNLTFSPTDKILDVGAGSGLITQLVKHELELNYALLTDVVDYRYPEVRNTRGIDFKVFKHPFNKIETDQKFQVAMITNTLHHCDHPNDVFKTMAGYLDTGAILFVIESCIGVNEEYVKSNSHSVKIPYQTLYADSNLLNKDQQEYLELSNEDKMIYGIFFDWLYNRVFLNENINVPYNFGHPEDWNVHFKNSSFEVLRTYLMGFDQPAALEFHTLHILRKT